MLVIIIIITPKLVRGLFTREKRNTWDEILKVKHRNFKLHYYFFLALCIVETKFILNVENL